MALRQGVQQVAHDSRERQQPTADADLRRRITELEWSRALSRRAHDAATLDAMFDTIQDGIRDGLGYDRVCIWLCDHDGGLYERRRGADTPAHGTAPAGRVPPPGGQAAHQHIPAVAALLAGSAFYYTGDGAGPYTGDGAGPYTGDGAGPTLLSPGDGDAAHLRSDGAGAAHTVPGAPDAPAPVLAVPLRSGGTVLGAIVVDNPVSERPIRPADAVPLLALAVQVEMAVERALLRERERREPTSPGSAAGSVDMPAGATDGPAGRGGSEPGVRAGDTHPLTDALTGLLNRYALLDHLDRAIAAGGPFTLLLLDIANFKLFTMTYGHVAGDQLLSEVALALRQVCHEQDVAGRYGDDEFAVVLHGATGNDARTMLRRLESMARDHQHVTADGVAIPLSVSAGLACYPSDGQTRQALISRAEGALLAAKRGQPSVRRSPHGGLLDEGHVGVLKGLVTAVDTKDRYTREHSEDVTRWALALAEALGLSVEQRRVLALAGPLHDVGKIAVPDRVLRKPGKLTRAEYEVMKHHVSFGVAILRGVLRDAAVIAAVAHHHERWDGTGYPHGLQGGQASLAGRIMQIADAVSAMRLDRPYRRSLPWARIVAELRAGAGTQFDPDLVEPFIAAASQRRA